MLLGIIFLNSELIKPHILRDEMILSIVGYKAKHILNRLFSCPYSDTIYSKNIKKIEKCPIFESLPFLYLSTFFDCKGGGRASSDHIMYLYNNKKMAPNR